jgi:hypothetical protein
MAEKIDISFSYTGSSEYSFDPIIDTNNNNSIVLSTEEGYQGIDSIPYDGATVTMKAESTSSRTFNPALNNRMFYLVTDQVYTPDQYDDIISAATEIYPTISGHGTVFTATFVFSNPNNYKNLYLIWDYVNDMDEGQTSGRDTDFERYIDIDYGSDLGRSGLYYDIDSTPARIKIQWGGEVVLDTGYVGLNSTANYNALIAAGVSDDDINLVEPYDGLVNNGTATATFNKYNSTGDAIIKVESPLTTVSWAIETVSPSLTSFFIDPTDGTIDDVCNQCPTTTYYHDGEGTRPVEGDRIFTDTAGASPYDGNSAYHLTDTVTCPGAPIADGQWIIVDSDGYVTATDTCNCVQFAPPLISQDSITFRVGQSESIRPVVSGDPTSWTVVSTIERLWLGQVEKRK